MRQSIAAGVNITYKILFNDAVAMTGGQPIDGTMKVPEMTRELDAEGRVVAVTDPLGNRWERELDVLRVGRDAARVEDIAAALHMAPGTVRNHISNAIGKLGVRTRQEAERAAWEAGWI